MISEGGPGPKSALHKWLLKPLVPRCVLHQKGPLSNNCGKCTIHSLPPWDACGSYCLSEVSSRAVRNLFNLLAVYFPHKISWDSVGRLQWIVQGLWPVPWPCSAGSPHTSQAPPGSPGCAVFSLGGSSPAPARRCTAANPDPA